MPKPIQFDKVADLYDSYVTVKFDIPFYLNATEGYDGEILELMCGTGRVSIPLLEAGRRMTCVDYSRGMLNVFASKIHNKNYPVKFVEMDVTQLNLPRRFGLILLPFHSFTEILTIDLQTRALHSIAKHMEPTGLLIVTLQNPSRRLHTADGQIRIIGEFTLEHNCRLVLSSMNQYDEKTNLVSGYQLYEMYDAANRLQEKRKLAIHFKPIMNKTFRSMIREVGLRIIEMCGDYSYSPFDETASDFMIYKLMKDE